MRAAISAVVVVLAILPAAAGAQYRTLDDRFAAPAFTSRAEWERAPRGCASTCSRRPACCRCPRRRRCNPVVFDELTHADYTRLEGVLREPARLLRHRATSTGRSGDGPFPAVLSPARPLDVRPPREHAADVRARAAPSTSRARASSSSRYDMVGYNDSRQLPHTFGGRARAPLGPEPRRPAALEQHPRARLPRVAALRAARRASASPASPAAARRRSCWPPSTRASPSAVPVNMISLHMQGGCLCENPPGLRLEHDQRRDRRDDRAAAAADGLGHRRLDRTRRSRWSIRPCARSTRWSGRRTACSAVRFDGRAQLQQGQPRGDVRLDGAVAEGRAVRRPACRSGASRRTRCPTCSSSTAARCPIDALTAGALTASWIAAAKRQLGADAARRCAPPRSGMRSAFAPEAASNRRRPRRVSRRRPSCWLPATTPDVEARAADGRLHRPRRSPSRRSTRPPPPRCGTSRPTTGPPPASASPTSSRRCAPSRAPSSWPPATRRSPACSRRPSSRRASPSSTSGGFDTSRDEDSWRALYIPGLRRAGDLQTASEMAPGRLVIHNAGRTFDGARRARAAGDAVAGRDRDARQGRRLSHAALAGTRRRLPPACLVSGHASSFIIPPRSRGGIIRGHTNRRWR